MQSPGEAEEGRGLAALALPPLGGLFAPDARGVVPGSAPDPKELLYGAELSNSALLSAVRHLAWIEVPGGRTQQVDYRNLGAEELGSVYEAPRPRAANLTRVPGPASRRETADSAGWGSVTQPSNLKVVSRLASLSRPEPWVG